MVLRIPDGHHLLKLKYDGPDDIVINLTEKELDELLQFKVGITSECEQVIDPYVCPWIRGIHTDENG